MANVFDYVDWRGDIPFSADPFNDVDNLIFSECAYIDFEGVLPGSGNDRGSSISVAEASKRYFELHSEEEVRRAGTLTAMAPFLLKKMAESIRFSQIRIGNYVRIFASETDEQMAALTFFLEDGSVYAAFRGTDDTITGWKEDLNLSFMDESPGQKHAAEYLTRSFAQGSYPVLTGGHSKGGNFAVYAAAFCCPQVQERILRIYTNDGPGFQKTVLDQKGYQAILPKICSIIPEGSFFGLLMNCGYDHQIVKSDQRGIYQHDALSWQVLGNHFVMTEKTSQSSAFMEKTMDRWLEGIAMEDRKYFVDTVYDMLTSGGATTVSGLAMDTLKGKFDVLRSFNNLEIDDRKMIRSILGSLLRSGVSVLYQDLSSDRMANTGDPATAINDHKAFGVHLSTEREMKTVDQKMNTAQQMAEAAAEGQKMPPALRSDA